MFWINSELTSKYNVLKNSHVNVSHRVINFGVFCEKEMYSVTPLIYLVMVAFAGLHFSVTFKDFLCRNNFIFWGHVTCRSPVMIDMVHCLLEFVAIISFSLSPGKLEQWMSLSWCRHQTERVVWKGIYSIPTLIYREYQEWVWSSHVV